MKWVKQSDNVFYLERNNGDHIACVSPAGGHWRATNYLDGSVCNVYTQEGAFAVVEGKVKAWYQAQATMLRDPLPRPKTPKRIATVVIVCIAPPDSVAMYVGIVNHVDGATEARRGNEVGAVRQYVAEMYSNSTVDWITENTGVIYKDA